jgi:hypothetical protein
MARYRTYQCISCEGKFRFLHHPNDAPPPDNCPLCGAATDGEPVFSPEAPAVRGVMGIAGDQIYRAMEAASASRAEMMADIGGGSAADYSHTKITDLKDNQREGDTAYKMPANPVQTFMQQNAQAAIGSQAAAVAQQYAAQAHSGYMPHAGSRTKDVISNVHGSMTARMRQLGQLKS